MSRCGVELCEGFNVGPERNIRLRALIATVFTAHALSVAATQTPPTNATPQELVPASAAPDLSLSYEVASVKPSTSRTTAYTVSIPPGRFLASYRTLNQLIAFAFDVRSIQVVGSPKWADSQHWDISAKTPAGVRWLEEHQAMLRRLLETRFALRHRGEMRALPVYELRRARQDGTLGPNLTPFEGDCRTSPNAPGVSCRFRVSANVVDAVGVDWATLDLARQFTELDRIVVDRTGLSGKFNIKLQWNRRSDSGAPGVSLFTALREQLGLQLAPTTGPVQVIVVEGARLPDPD